MVITHSTAPGSVVKPPNVKKSTSNNVELSAGNPNYITPDDVAAAGRYVVGGYFDLDVASCEIANRVIQAKKFFDPSSDGLRQNWGNRKRPKSVWLNAPGGTIRYIDEHNTPRILKSGDTLEFDRGRWVTCRGGQCLSSQYVWLEKFKQQRNAGNCWGVYLSFNPEPVVRNHADLLEQFPHCWFYDRPNFQNFDAQLDEFVPDTQPRKHCLVILLPPKDKDFARAVTRRFKEAFGEFGRVIDPTPPPPSLKSLLEGANELDAEQLLELQGLINTMVGVHFGDLTPESSENDAIEIGVGRYGTGVVVDGQRGYVEWKKIKGKKYPYLRWQEPQPNPDNNRRYKLANMYLGNKKGWQRPDERKKENRGQSDD